MHCFVETETLQMSEYSSNHCLCTEEQNQIKCVANQMVCLPNNFMVS